MKIVNRRIALLTGASVAVLGVAAPAYAATTVTPGVCSASDTVDITLLGDTGVTSVNDPALAVVNGCATGEVQQGAPVGGDVTETITNGAAGDVNIAAIATATSAAGNASAIASIVGAGVDQLGEGTGNVDLAINNAGGLAIEAIANATATGVAHASANFSGAPLAMVSISRLMDSPLVERRRLAHRSTTRPTRRSQCLQAPTPMAPPPPPMQTRNSESGRSEMAQAPSPST